MNEDKCPEPVVHDHSKLSNIIMNRNIALGATIFGMTTVLLMALDSLGRKR